MILPHNLRLFSLHTLVTFLCNAIVVIKNPESLVLFLILFMDIWDLLVILCTIWWRFHSYISYLGHERVTIKTLMILISEIRLIIIHGLDYRPLVNSICKLGSFLMIFLSLQKHFETFKRIFANSTWPLLTTSESFHIFWANTF